MCYNVSVIVDISILEGRFEAKLRQPGLFKEYYHASGFTAPFLPVITNENQSEIELFQWGLIPFWTKDEESANEIRLRTLNARAETIFQKRSFSHAILHKRCLVLVDGFYEWQEVEKKKYPYYISLHDHRSFAFAGIWDSWFNKEKGETRNTFSIITTSANGLMERIHNTRKRMPVILRQEDEKRWLSPGIGADEIASMLKPYDDREMEAYTVSRLISSRGLNTNTPEVIEKTFYPELDSTSGV